MITDGSAPVVGNTLTVRIEIENARDVTSVPFHVVYNPTVLRFEGGIEGGFLAAAGQTAFFAAPMSSGAELVVGLSRLGGGPGADGAGELCELRFSVVGPGEAGLSFLRAKVRDSENKIVPSVFTPTAVLAR